MTHSIQGSPRQEKPAFTPCEQAALVAALITTLALAAISGMASFNGMSSHYLGGVVSANALFGFAAPAAVVLFVFFCIKSCSHNSLEKTNGEDKSVSEKEQTSPRTSSSTPATSSSSATMAKETSQVLHDFKAQCKKYITTIFQRDFDLNKRNFIRAVEDYLNNKSLLHEVGKDCMRAIRSNLAPYVSLGAESLNQLIWNECHFLLAGIQTKFVHILLDNAVPKIDIGENPQSWESLIKLTDAAIHKTRDKDKAFIDIFEKILSSLDKLEKTAKTFINEKLENEISKVSHSDKHLLEKARDTTNQIIERTSSGLQNEIRFIIQSLEIRREKAESDIQEQMNQLQTTRYNHRMELMALEKRFSLEYTPLLKNIETDAEKLRKKLTEIQQAGLNGANMPDIEENPFSRSHQVSDISKFLERQDAFINALEAGLKKGNNNVLRHSAISLRPSSNKTIKSFAETEFNNSCSAFGREIDSRISQLRAKVIEARDELNAMLPPISVPTATA